MKEKIVPYFLRILMVVLLIGGCNTASAGFLAGLVSIYEGEVFESISPSGIEQSSIEGDTMTCIITEDFVDMTEGNARDIYKFEKFVDGGRYYKSENYPANSMWVSKDKSRITKISDLKQYQLTMKSYWNLRR